jgi:hypothetical protein
MAQLSPLTKLALQGLSLGAFATGCTSNDSPTSAATDSNAAAKTAFKTSCIDAGNSVTETTCKGTATCAGTYYDKATNKIIQTTCAGTNSCEGIQCLSKNAMSSMATSSMASSSMSSAMMSSVGQSSSNSTATALLRAAILKSTTADEFKAACTAAQKTAIDAVCNGHNDCAGIYFHTGSYGTKVGAVEYSCSGKNTCAGFKCEI